MSKLIVLCHTAQEASLVARELEIPLQNIRIVGHADQLRGLSNPRVILLPSFWERPDALEVWDVLSACYGGVKGGLGIIPRARFDQLSEERNKIQAENEEFRRQERRTDFVDRHATHRVTDDTSDDESDEQHHARYARQKQFKKINVT